VSHRFRELIFGIAALAGCAPSSAALGVGAVQLPQAFDGASSGPSAAQTDWRAFFGDEILVGLLAEALSNNLDLRIALQRLEVARANVRGSTGALLPEIAAVAGASGTRFARYTLDGSGAATTDITPGRITPNPVADLAFGLHASWELDIWGKLRSLKGAARAKYLASLEATHGVVTSLIADVATSYFDLLALDHVRDVLRETITRQTLSLEMIRAQKEAGRANELAVQQFEAELANTRAMDAATTQRTREVENRMNVLLGRMPSAVPRAHGQLLRDLPPTMATGVPSDLLRARPDIREAEVMVEASRFDLATARAAFYPSLTITASAGYSAFTPRFLLSTPESIFATLAGGLVGPIVNRRAIEAQFAAARASQIEAMYRYQNVVITAFSEVATGLSALEQLATIVEQHRHKKASLAGAVDSADALFRAGKASYLEVLLTQQNTVEAEIELIEALRARNVARVALYRALGGGWRGSYAWAGATSPAD